MNASFSCIGVCSIHSMRHPPHRHLWCHPLSRFVCHPETRFVPTPPAVAGMIRNPSVLKKKPRAPEAAPLKLTLDPLPAAPAPRAYAEQPPGE
jgi:hypothetical protein